MNEISKAQRQLKRGQPGYIHHPLYVILLDACQSIPGVFIEFGVFQGFTFSLIYERALRYGKRTVGVDSFIGHPESQVKRIGDKWVGNMWPGKYSAGGSSTFRQEFPNALCVEGFIPNILPEIDDIEIAFAHLDLDLYDSTAAALRFTWGRLSKGGIMIGHDFGWDADYGAPQAYQDWMAEMDIKHIGIEEKSIYFKKL